MRPALRHLANVNTRPSSSTSTTSPRSTRLRSKPISLDGFIQRGRVLSLYRSIVRSLYRIPAEGRSEPLSYARGEFNRHRDVSDITQIRYLISTGKTEWDGMRRYVDELAARGK